MLEVALTAYTDCLKYNFIQRVNPLPLLKKKKVQKHDEYYLNAMNEKTYISTVYKIMQQIKNKQRITIYLCISYD